MQCLTLNMLVMVRWSGEDAETTRLWTVVFATEEADSVQQWGRFYSTSERTDPY